VARRGGGLAEHGGRPLEILRLGGTGRARLPLQHPRHAGRGAFRQVALQLGPARTEARPTMEVDDAAEVPPRLGRGVVTVPGVHPGPRGRSNRARPPHTKSRRTEPAPTGAGSDRFLSEAAPSADPLNTAVILIRGPVGGFSLNFPGRDGESPT